MGLPSSLAWRLSISHLVVALAAVTAFSVGVWALGTGATDRYLTMVEGFQDRVGFVPPGIARQQAAAAAGLREELAGATLVATGLAALIGVVLALVVARHLSRPVRAAAGAARRVSAGERRVDVPAPGIAELDELAEALERLGGDLESAERQRDRLVDDVMHELRTPLTVVRGYLEAIRDGVMSADAMIIGRTLDELHRMERLVDDLRASTEVSSDDLRRRPVPARVLLADARDRHRLHAAQRQVELELVDDTRDATVAVDSARMAQVLDNLLENALVHAPRGTTVTLRGRKDDGRLAIDVTDRGDGIPPEQQPLVFERLYRGDSARDRNTGGAGIGLAIARRLVETHGGTIALESVPGHGATFTVRLPLTDS